MRILITTDCYIPTVNGVVTSIINLENALRKRGHEVKILCPSENLQNSVDGDVHRIGSVSVDKLYSGARAAIFMQKKNLQSIIDWKPDIIHSQTEFTAYIMAKKIAYAVGCPIIHTYHTVYEDYTHYFSPSPKIGKAFAMHATRFIVNGVRAAVVPSRKIKNLLRGYDIRKPICIVPTGLDIARFLDSPEPEIIVQMKDKLGIPLHHKVLVTVGRAAKEKNTDELIQYFKRLGLKNTTLLIVGGGPYLEKLRELAQRLKITEKVKFTGMVDPQDIPAYYHLGDVFLNASQSETQGLTYVEALASGLPMLCRKDECLDEVLYNGKNGYQYTSFNEFSQSLGYLLRSDELREQMSRISRRIARRFSNEVFAESIERIYIQLCARRRDLYKLRRHAMA